MNTKMNTKLSILVAALVVLLLAVPGAWGVEFRNGTSVSVPAGTTLPDDLYAAGQNVNIAGTVNGDLFGAGSNITMTGATTHDAILSGGTVNITGRTGDDLRAAGGTVNISGAVVDSASVAGGTVNIQSAGTIGRNLGVAGRTIVIDGRVVRNLVATGGGVTINGIIGGNVQANANRLSIGPNAVIRGNLVYTGPQRASIASGARILGATTYHPMARHPQHKKAPLALFGLWLLSLLGAFIVGALIIALSPATSVRIAEAIRTKPWISILIGFILLVVMPVLIIAIAITVVGIPLALILLATYLISLYIAHIFVALAIGRWIFGRFGRPNTSLYVDLLVGLLILWVLMPIPFLGGLIGFIALLLGLGALATQRYTMMRDLRSEGRI